MAEAVRVAGDREVEDQTDGGGGGEVVVVDAQRVPPCAHGGGPVRDVPHRTDDMSEAELAALVTRDSMIGTGLAASPASAGPGSAAD